MRRDGVCQSLYDVAPVVTFHILHYRPSGGGVNGAGKGCHESAGGMVRRGDGRSR